MRIIDVLTSPWAIQPEKYAEIVRIYQARARGEVTDIKSVEAQLGFPLDNEQQRYETIDGVAVIPVMGVLGKRMNMLTQISGGSSTQLIMQDFASAMNDPVVKSVMLLVDSPGGTVDGTQDLANAIYQARGVKPVYALADGVAASAAYWIASAADMAFASNGTAQVGSIGVVTSHTDISKSEERAGIRTTDIYAGKYKRIVSEYKPLDAEGQEYLQGFVDYMYSVFVEDVARNRGTDAETVLSEMADGRVFIGQQAVDAGLVDGIMSYGELLAAMKDEGGDVDSRSAQPGGFPIKTSGMTGGVANREIGEPGKGMTEDGEGNSDGPNNNQQGGVAMIKGQKKVTGATGMTGGGAPGMAGAANAPGTIDAGQIVAATLTVDDVLRDYPEIADAIYQTGFDAGEVEERTRVQDVEAQALPGHEKLIAVLKYDGKTTGPEAAAQVVAAEKGLRETRLSALETLSVAPVAPLAGQPDGTTTLTAEEKEDRDWKGKAELRAEFGDKREAYDAYMKRHRADDQD